MGQPKNIMPLAKAVAGAERQTIETFLKALVDCINTRDAGDEPDKT